MTELASIYWVSLAMSGLVLMLQLGLVAIWAFCTFFFGFIGPLSRVRMVLTFLLMFLGVWWSHNGADVGVQLIRSAVALGTYGGVVVVALVAAALHENRALRRERQSQIQARRIQNSQ
jgi:hypothetical protein